MKKKIIMKTLLKEIKELQEEKYNIKLYTKVFVKRLFRVQALLSHGILAMGTSFASLILSFAGIDSGHYMLGNFDFFITILLFILGIIFFLSYAVAIIELKGKYKRRRL